MMIRESVPLKELTTLRVGGPALAVATCDSAESLSAALAYARERGLPTYPLGQGSNVLAADSGFPGLILLMQMTGIDFNGVDDTVVDISVGAGVVWEEVTRAAAARGLWGIENLAGIPGTMGAAPVQNIGAYGTELAACVHLVEVLNQATGEVHVFNNAECAFGYRESRFKHDAALIITKVTLRLARSGTAQTTYADLARVADTGVDMSTPGAVGDAVRHIRAGKFPDLATCGTAGSFFKNPVISAATFAELAQRYPELPGYQTTTGIKLSLAWILDKLLNLRGYAVGPVRLYEKQPLVVVAGAGATARDVEILAEDVARRVYDATGVTIEREVRSLG